MTMTTAGQKIPALMTAREAMAMAAAAARDGDAEIGRLWLDIARELRVGSTRSASGFASGGVVSPSGLNFSLEPGETLVDRRGEPFAPAAATGLLDLGQRYEDEPQTVAQASAPIFGSLEPPLSEADFQMTQRATDLAGSDRDRGAETTLLRRPYSDVPVGSTSSCRFCNERITYARQSGDSDAAVWYHDLTMQRVCATSHPEGGHTFAAPPLPTS